MVVAAVGGMGVASGKGVHKKCKLHPALPTPWCVAHNRPTAPPAVPHLPQMPRLLPRFFFIREWRRKKVILALCGLIFYIAGITPLMFLTKQVQSTPEFKSKDVALSGCVTRFFQTENMYSFLLGAHERRQQ